MGRLECVARRADGQERQHERDRQDLAPAGRETVAGQLPVGEDRLGEPEPEPRSDGLPRRPEADRQRGNQPLTPSSAPVSTSKGALGAAAIAPSAATAPASAKARVSSRSTGTPIARAAAGSSAIARSPLPTRERASKAVVAAASASVTPRTKNERTCTEAPAIVTTPPRPIRSNGSGSGKTWLGASTSRSDRIAKARATVAATQPTVQPRATYGCTAAT